MFREARTLVLFQRKNYYLAKYALDSVFDIVQTVTESESRVHLISEGQVAKIRLLALAEGVEVKIARSQEEIEQLALIGECELTPLHWTLMGS